MNYVKHLSIALLVLGTASVYASAPVEKTSADSKKVLDTVKSYYNTYLGTEATAKTRASVLIPASIFLTAVAYKTVPAFKDAADNAVEVGQNFLTDLKDNNGNARRNAGIATSVVALVGGAYYFRDKIKALVPTKPQA
jgi:hypothetical protein